MRRDGTFNFIVSMLRAYSTLSQFNLTLLQITHGNKRHHVATIMSEPLTMLKDKHTSDGGLFEDICMAAKRMEKFFYR